MPETKKTKEAKEKTPEIIGDERAQLAKLKRQAKQKLVPVYDWRFFKFFLQLQARLYEQSQKLLSRRSIRDQNRQIANERRNVNPIQGFEQKEVSCAAIKKLAKAKRSRSQSLDLRPKLSPNINSKVAHALDLFVDTRSKLKMNALAPAGPPEIENPSQSRLQRFFLSGGTDELIADYLGYRELARLFSVSKKVSAFSKKWADIWKLDKLSLLAESLKIALVDGRALQETIVSISNADEPLKFPSAAEITAISVNRTSGKQKLKALEALLATPLYFFLLLIHHHSAKKILHFPKVLVDLFSCPEIFPLPSILFINVQELQQTLVNYLGLLVNSDAYLPEARCILRSGISPNLPLTIMAEEAPEEKVKNCSNMLIRATASGSQKMVELLLHHRAQVNAISFPGWPDCSDATPIKEAAVRGYYYVVNQLIYAGANVDRAPWIGIIEILSEHCILLASEICKELKLVSGDDWTDKSRSFLRNKVFDFVIEHHAEGQWDPSLIGELARYKDEILKRILLLSEQDRFGKGLVLLQAAADEKQQSILSKVLHVKRGVFEITLGSGSLGKVNKEIKKRQRECLKTARPRDVIEQKEEKLKPSPESKISTLDRWRVLKYHQTITFEWFHEFERRQLAAEKKKAARLAAEIEKLQDSAATNSVAAVVPEAKDETPRAEMH